MPTKNELDKFIADTDPRDGFGISESTLGTYVSLNLIFRQGGNCQPLPWDPSRAFVEIQRWNKPLSDADYGEKRRIILLLEAMCRFLNTGGSFRHIDFLVAQLRETTAGGSREFGFPDYHLIDSSLNDDGDFEHVFASDTSPYAVRWVEGEFLDVVPLADMKRELDEEERKAADAVTELTGADGSLPGLPAAADPAAAEPGLSNSEPDVPEHNG